MSTSQWRLVAGLALLIAVVAVGVSLVTRSAGERDSARSVVVLDSVTASLHDAQALARAGLTASAAYKAERDSLQGIAARIDTVYPRRQHTVRVADTADTVAVVLMVAQLAAERDTAIVDRDHARADVQTLHGVVNAPSEAATEHARTDAIRLAQISAHLTVATEDVAHARTLVARPWWKRWGTTAGRVGKAATIGIIGYGLGRLT